MERGPIQARYQKISRLGTSKAEPNPAVLRVKEYIPTAKLPQWLAGM